MTTWKQFDKTTWGDGKRFLIYKTGKRFLLLDTEGSAKDKTLYPYMGTFTGCRKTAAKIRRRSCMT